MKRAFHSAALILPWVFLAFAWNELAAETFNGFKLTNALISEKEIHSGGVGKDGIPAIDEPQFLPPDKAEYLEDADWVASITIAGVTRAYPLRILVWHEIVNDQLGGQSFMVTYCPLCGSVMAFNRRIYGKDLTFGVSGLLYQSDVLMYDRETMSLWSQLGMKAVTGDMSNTTLEIIPSEILSWRAWKAQHPSGMVLSTHTGFSRDYTQNSYEDYAQSPDTLFPVPLHRLDLPKKSWVVGILVGQQAKAYPLEKLAGHSPAIDRIGNVWIEAAYDSASSHLSVKGRDSGANIPYVKLYWFAWQAFYPKTLLWNP